MITNPELPSIIEIVKRWLALQTEEREFDWVTTPRAEFNWVSTGTTQSKHESNGSRKIAGIVLVILLAAGMMSFFSASAVAHTTFTAGDVATTSNNGVLTSLTVAPEGDIHYNGLEQPPSRIDLVVSIKQSGGSWEQIETKTLTASGLEGTVPFNFDNIDVLKQSSLTAADFRAADGETATTELTIQVGATLVGAGPTGSDVTTTGTDTFTVTVTNEAAGATVGGEANTNGN